MPPRLINRSIRYFPASVRPSNGSSAFCKTDASAEQSVIVSGYRFSQCGQTFIGGEPFPGFVCLAYHTVFVASKDAFVIQKGCERNLEGSLAFQSDGFSAILVRLARLPRK